MFRRKELKYFLVYFSVVIAVVLKQVTRTYNLVSLNVSYVGFLIIEISILVALIHSFKEFSIALKKYHKERYIKVKKEMYYFMICWTLPLIASLIIRSIILIESTGLANFSDDSRNFFRTLQTISYGFVFIF